MKRNVFIDSKDTGICRTGSLEIFTKLYPSVIAHIRPGKKSKEMTRESSYVASRKNYLTLDTSLFIFILSIWDWDEIIDSAF